MGTLKPLSGVIKLTLSIETPVIHVQGGFKVPMETGRNLEHTTERHQRGFKMPMETGSMTLQGGADKLGQNSFFYYGFVYGRILVQIL